MDKTFIFDLDDTIIKNYGIYLAIKQEFASYAIKRLNSKYSANAQDWIDLVEDTDKKLVETMGFSSERFPLSFRKTYENVCESFGIEDKIGAKEVHKLGKLVFDEEHWKRKGVGGFIDGAEETLDYLTEKEDELILVTKGDRKMQMKKIELYSLERWFSEISVVDKKDGKIVSQIAGRRNKDLVWHVGNLIRSDVLPGLEAGVKVIYIPHETWAYEKQHNGLPESDRVIKLNSIKEIKEKYDSLFLTSQSYNCYY